MTLLYMGLRKMVATAFKHSMNSLERNRERNCKLNPDMLVKRTTEISFFGHIISHNGVKPGLEKKV